MKKSLEAGLSFGLTSGIITTLGLMIGLYESSQSELVVVGGILTIAIADAFSDALGMHISSESEKKKTKTIWQETFSTFFSKFFIALTFLIPLLFFKLSQAVFVSTCYGVLIIGILSYMIAKQEHQKPWKVILEHLTIAVIVIIVTFFVGKWIRTIFV